ncbi:MAG: C-GCAxxG-C-C family protein [Clostridia bacterium]|nr:C-GCAxxG-C-C family protein [Clostridia bacterium]
MLADIAQRYFLEEDYNCAESMLLAANEYYALGLDSRRCHLLVSAFGGGMGCGSVCGALAGAMAALGQMTVADRAHKAENFKAVCAGYVARFEAALGSQRCDEIKPALFQEGLRCARAVYLAAQELEAYMQELGKQNA